MKNSKITILFQFQLVRLKTPEFLKTLQIYEKVLQI